MIANVKHICDSTNYKYTRVRSTQDSWDGINLNRTQNLRACLPKIIEIILASPDSQIPKATYY